MEKKDDEPQKTNNNAKSNNTQKDKNINENKNNDNLIDKDKNKKNDEKPDKNENKENDGKKSDKDKNKETDGKKSDKDKNKENDQSNEKKSLAQEIQEASKNSSNNVPIDDSDNEELAVFTRKKTEKEFSMWSLNEWLHDYLKDWNSLVVYFIEILIISIILLLPSSLWIIQNWKTINILSYFKNPGKITSNDEGLFRIAIFAILIYSFDIVATIISDGFIVIFGILLYTFQLSESEFCWCMVDVLYKSRKYFVISSDCLFCFYLSTIMFEKYQKPKNFDIFNWITIVTLILWVGIYVGMTYIMKFVVNILIYDIRRTSNKEKIWDLNFKTFIFKKLKAISEANDKNEVAQNMKCTYDPGFFLKDMDLFESKEDAGIVVQNSMARLKKKKLTYNDIKKYYPSECDMIFKYFTESEKIEEKRTIRLKNLIELAKTLYSKRKDMLKTLNDRDSIFEKLEFIFFLGVTYIAVIILFWLFNKNFTVYFLGLGTSLLTVSWIFADMIKKVFICFIFVLIIRPFAIGDRVKITDEEFFVTKIDLLTTTFLNQTKTVVYLPNDFLMGTKIHNFARSPPQFMLVEITVEDATYSEIKKLEESIKSEVKKASGHFIDAEFVKKIDNKVTFSINIVQNFQSYETTKSREKKLISIFESTLKKCGIAHKNSYEIKLS